MGGFTDVVTMPNTRPVGILPGAMHLMLDSAREAGLCRVHPAGAMTMGLKSERMVEYADLVDAGAVGFTDGATRGATEG